MFQKYHFFHNPKLLVDEFQYLGTIFSRKGNFGRSKARLVQQARKAMFYVLRNKYIALRDVCNSAAVSANITVSSAHSNKYNLKYTSISSFSNNKCEILQTSLRPQGHSSTRAKVNTAKTNVVIFSKSRQRENIDFIYNNERLTVVDEFQYLGTIYIIKTIVSM
jgi:hypothetical protein